MQGCFFFTFQEKIEFEMKISPANRQKGALSSIDYLSFISGKVNHCSAGYIMKLVVTSLSRKRVFQYGSKALSSSSICDDAALSS